MYAFDGQLAYRGTIPKPITYKVIALPIEL